MTGAFSGSGRPKQGPPRVPTAPSGWPIGSYDTYQEAHRAVEYLAANGGDEFPVEGLTMVGVDLMLVERVLGRMTWPKVLGGGALSGAWFGLFVGLLLGLFSPNTMSIAPILVGLVAGVVFGLVFAVVGYATTKSGREISSSSQLVAGRYDVLCPPRHAEKGRDLLARLAMRPSGAVD